MPPSAARPSPSFPLIVLLVAMMAALLAPRPARAVMLPAGFTDAVLPWTFTEPTCIRFLPDGRLLVAEKQGRIWLIENGQRSTMWARQSEVLDMGDRGLLSIEVDPLFATDRWLYLFYSVDPDSNNKETDDDCYGRLVRYQVSAANPHTIDLSTRQVLIGTTWSNGFPNGSITHAVAALAWGRDSTLLVCAGDGAHYEYLDAGGHDAPMFAPGLADPAEDIGAFRARMTGSLNGKILRVDRATGLGLPSNPYWDGNPASKASRVYAYGLRNPFRIAVRPGTGSLDVSAGDPGILYIGDVGWETWEEFDVLRQPGLDLGWPCHEGPVTRPDYMAATPAHDGCNPLATPLAPIAWFHHTDGTLSQPAGIEGAAAIGGVFYRGPRYPAGYYGGWFVADYVTGWIMVLHTDAQDHFVSLDEFAYDAGGPVGFDTDPLTGDVWYIAHNDGLIHHIAYNATVGVPDGGPPHLTLRPARPNPTHGAARIAFELPRPGVAECTVFDATGREVWRTRAELPAGPGAFLWPGLAGGRPARDGLYFVRLRSRGEQATGRLVVTR